MTHIDLYKLAMDALIAEKNFGCCAFYVQKREDAISALQAAIEKDEPDKDFTQAITERDEYHDMADKLAGGIALHFDGDIGEHSSSNSPWDRALDLLDSAACSETMRLSTALTAALAEPLCIDEGCDHHGTPHICVEKRKVCRFPDCHCKVYDGTHCEDMATVEIKQAAIDAPSAEPVGKVVSSGPADFPIFKWISADHSLRCKTGDLLYLHPPVHEPLSDARLEEIYRQIPSLNAWVFSDSIKQFARAIEAAIRGKT